MTRIGKPEFVGKFPRYAFFGGLNGTAMRLDGKGYYYRDGGAWGTRAKFVKGKLMSYGHSGDFAYLNNKELVPCSEYEWWKDNGEYAGKIHAERVRKLSCYGD